MANQVLVVDDDKPTLQMYRVALEMKGLAVRAAVDGCAAIQLLESGYVPDVMLVDWRMPGMNGSRFYHAVNQFDPWKNIPLLVVSASTNDVPSEIPSLEKPFELAQLYAKINQTVGYSLIC